MNDAFSSLQASVEYFWAAKTFKYAETHFKVILTTKFCEDNRLLCHFHELILSANLDLLIYLERQNKFFDLILSQPSLGNVFMKNVSI